MTTGQRDSDRWLAVPPLAAGRRSSAAPPRRGAVHFDLAVDLGPVEHRALDDIRIVPAHHVLDRSDVKATAPPIATRTPPAGPLPQKA